MLTGLTMSGHPWLTKLSVGLQRKQCITGGGPKRLKNPFGKLVPCMKRPWRSLMRITQGVWID